MAASHSQPHHSLGYIIFIVFVWPFFLLGGGTAARPALSRAPADLAPLVGISLAILLGGDSDGVAGRVLGLAVIGVVCHQAVHGNLRGAEVSQQR